MEPHHRRALHKSMVELTADLDPLEIIPELIASEIMTSEDFEELRSKPNRKLQVIDFISTLERRGPEAFQTLLFALHKRPFYKELVTTLEHHEQSLKAQVKTEIEEFVNASNRDDTFEFLDMKLNLGELIEKRDALKLCEHFKLQEDATSVVQSSGNPGLAVLESLEKLQHFTASNISPVLQVVSDLALEEAASLLQGYKKRSTLPELAVTLKISVGSNPSSSLAQDGTDFLRDFPSNRNHVFRKQRELQTFFQEEFSVWLVGLRPGTIVLKLPKLETLLFALHKRPFYKELVTTLEHHEQSLKAQVKTEIEEFVNASNRDDTFEFLDMKLNLGELIEKRDALKLCEHFKLQEDATSVVQSSGNPGLAVLESLEKLQHFTASNISPVLQVVSDLALEEAASLLQGYKKRSTLPELAVTLKISVGSNPSSSLAQDGTDFLRDFPSNRNHVFRKQRELQTFFQEEFSVWLVGLRPGTIVLKLPKLENLLKLENQICSGELAEKLSSILLKNFNEGSLMIGGTGQLQASCDETFLNKAKKKLAGKDSSSLVLTSDEEEDFPPYEETDDNEMLTADGDSFKFERLLELICLKDKFPGKMGLQEFVKVKRTCSMEGAASMVELFWQKLSSLDYRVRSDRFLRLNDLQKVSIRDFIFAVIQCSDRFLRQDIIEKMSACHLAVPVLLPGVYGRKSEFLLWSLRRIVKKWKESNSLALEQHIVQVPVFTVSFLRIGEIKGFSKSSIINTLLGPHQGNDPHPFFLTKEDDPCKPTFSQGCLESVWYLPMNTNGSEKFRWITTVLNLRGDCSEFPLHTHFACTAATLTIAFIAIRNRPNKRSTIRDIKSVSNKFFFIAINDERDKLPQNKTKFAEPNSEWIHYHSLELEGIFDKISSKIAYCHDENKAHYRTLEELPDLCEDKIKVDEDIKECNDAKRLVKEIIDMKEDEDLSEFKKRAFPLQAFWMEWVHIDKERLKPDTEREESVEFSRDDIARRKAEKRHQQLKCSLSPTMQTFRKALGKSGKNLKNLGYFLFYLQETLFRLADADTRKHLENIATYDKEIQELDALIKPTLSNETTGDKNREKELRYKKERQEWKHRRLEESEICRKKSIGWEHFLRELGQWHEAHTELDVRKDDITISLPGIAARLLVHGYSLEIMDGDTGRVPLSWITSVLDKLTQNLRDPKVLVLCVVGVQSSGKSTLLNSMFGVKFPVRAGRCTRGLFIQMLTVDDVYAEKLGVEYIVLVDSEGIRSLEKNSKEDCRFDNELVTLALCISDITILNIEGENIGPEMTGILEIAAHALIKMKKVKLHSQCRIIQQRVSDLTAGERNKINMNQIVETLNEAVVVAADEEGYVDRYQQFSDVFGLRLDDNLQFIPCLWTGPMSPPSQFYSEVITKVKEDILSEIESQKLVPQFTVSSFTQRIRDVWEAVKDEKFLFNFQDSIKAVDFNNLCMELSKRITDIRLKLVDKREKWQRSIQTTEKNPDVTFRRIKEECRGELQTQKHDMFSSLETIIYQHKRKDSLLHYWKWLQQSVEMNFTDIENDLLSALENDATTKRLEDSISQCVVSAKNDLRAYAKKEADRQRLAGSKSVKGRKENDPKKLFSVKWEQLLEGGIKKFPLEPMSEKVMEVTCETLLIAITTDMAVSTEIQKLSKEEGGIKKHSQIEDWEKYYPDKAGEQHVKEWFLQNQHILQAVIDKSISKLRDESSLKAFDANLFQSILRHVLQTFAPPQLTSDPPYFLKAKLLLHIGGKLFSVALQNQRLYEAENSFEKLFNKEKKNLHEDFLTFLRNENQVYRAVKCMERYLHEWGKELLLNCLRKNMSRVIEQTDLDDIFHVRNEILKELCTKKVLDEYIQYIENHQEIIKLWINDQVVRLFSETKEGKLELRQIMEIEMTNIRLDIISFVNSVSTKVEEGKDLPKREAMSFKTWTDHFVKGLRERGCPRFNDLLLELKSYNISDLDNFTYQLIEFLQSIWADNIYKDIKMPSESIEADVTAFVTPLASPIINEALKYSCFEQCPFCKAPCDNPLPIGPQHSHASFTHLPRGISGIQNAGTSQLCIDSCPTCVQSSTATYKLSSDKKKSQRLCRDYTKDFPRWVIKPPSEMIPNYTLFWKWVMKTYNSQFAAHYRCTEAKIPSSWKKISKKDVLQSFNNRPNFSLKVEGSFTSSGAQRFPSKFT